MTGEGTTVLDHHFERLKPDGATLTALRAVALSDRSLLARRMLARLACPTDPEAPLAPGELRSDGRLHIAAAVVLATVLGTQPLEPWHRERALAIYDRLLDEGNEIVNAAHQSMHAQLMLHLGETERLREALRVYKNLERPIRRALETELFRLDHREDARGLLRRFQQFAGWADLDLHLRPADVPLLDRMELAGPPPVQGGQRISVIMSCYRPGLELLTSIRSVIAQTWQNWELLLVDDASGPESDALLAEAAALDPRVRLLRSDRNGGTYLARNLALKEAAGTFVTGLDSDDWAHPRWLEAQVEPMSRSREIVMTYSEGIRATGDLGLVLTPGRRLTEVRSTSIMYRRAEVLPELGRFDAIRKSADSEFRFRLVSRFGAKATASVPGRFTIVRQEAGTLSHGEIGEGWMHPARFAYESAFRHWHMAIRAGGDAYLGDDRPRALYAPRRIVDTATAPVTFDRLYLADWREWTGHHQALLKSARAVIAEGGSVAFAHLPRPWAFDLVKKPIAAEVLAFALEHSVEFVDRSAITVASVVVPDLEAEAALLVEQSDGIGAPVEVLDKRPVRVTAPRRPQRARRQPGPKALAALLAAAACAAVLGAVDATPFGPALLTGALVFAGGNAVLLAQTMASRLQRRY